MIFNKSSKANFSILLSIGILLVVVLTGCTPEPEQLPPSAEDIQTAIAQTQSAFSTPTFAPTFTPSPVPTQTNTPEPTPSPTPIGPIAGSVNTEYLNMRSGPGTSFEIIQTFVIDTELSAISRSPDSQWVEVIIEFEQEDDEDPLAPLQGWMFIDLLDLDGDPTKLPETAVEDSGIIQGVVKNSDDQPLSGVIVAIVYQSDDLEINTEVTSDEEGLFEVYVPAGLAGVFDVQIYSWDCDSPVVNLDCELSGYIIQADREFIALPQGAPVEFIFESTDLTLAGTALGADGKAADSVTIIAERDDGSISYGRTDAQGEFEMPIGEGIWDVYTIVYNPYEEGEPIQVEVADESPEPIELVTP